MKNKSNVILILTDQLRHDLLGCYGNKIIRTPSLDSLASDGITYKNAYSTCPACVPARGCCLTGLNQWNLHSISYAAKLEPDYPVTIPKLMKSQGYQTIAIGKNHFHPQRAMHGYDRIMLDESSRVESTNFESDYITWFKKQTGHSRIISSDMDFNGYNGESYPYDEKLHPTSWVKNCAITELENTNKNAPFFMKISFARPHSPYDAPKRLFDYYMNCDLPMPTKSEWGRKYAKRKQSLTRWCGVATIEEHKKTRAGYYGNVEFIDEAVGEILQYLRDMNIYDDTMIIFTSDHGDMLGDHNLWRKTYAYEGSTHIPFIIKPCKNDSIHHANNLTPATLYDIAKTISNSVCDDTFETDGIDLLSESRDILHGEYISGYDNNMDMHYLVDGKYKFIWYMRTGIIELYDLEHDKNEQVNLANDKRHTDAKERFISYIVSLMRSRGIDILKHGKIKRYRFKLPYNIYGKLI